MMHIDDDTLLKFVLETLDEPDNATVREHLSSCPLCSGKRLELQREVGSLASVDLQVDAVEPPRLPQRSRRSMVIARFAAVLAVGFVAGYLMAELSAPQTTTTVGQQLRPAPVNTPVTRPVPCGAIDI
jgi:anti-sigma factor RsiW